MKNAALLLSLTVLIGLAGCTGPTFTFANRKVSINSSPPGAKVYQINSVYKNENFLGTTPIIDQPVRILVDVKGRLNPTIRDWMESQKTMLNVRVEKRGYQDFHGNLATDPSKTTAHLISLEQ